MICLIFKCGGKRSWPVHFHLTQTICHTAYRRICAARSSLNNSDIEAEYPYSNIGHLRLGQKRAE